MHSVAAQDANGIALRATTAPFDVLPPKRRRPSRHPSGTSSSSNQSQEIGPQANKNRAANNQFVVESTTSSAGERYTPTLRPVSEQHPFDADGIVKKNNKVHRGKTIEYKSVHHWLVSGQNVKEHNGDFALDHCCCNKSSPAISELQISKLSLNKSANNQPHRRGNPNRDYNVSSKQTIEPKQMSDNQVCGQVLSQSSSVVVKSNSMSNDGGVNYKMKQQISTTTTIRGEIKVAKTKECDNDEANPSKNLLEVRHSRQSLSVKSVPIEKDCDAADRIRRTLSFVSTAPIGDDSELARRKFSEAGNVSDKLQLDALGCNAPTRKRSITTYLKQKFRSKDLAWQTDFAVDEDDNDEGDEDSDALDAAYEGNGDTGASSNDLYSLSACGSIFEAGLASCKAVDRSFSSGQREKALITTTTTTRTTRSSLGETGARDEATRFDQNTKDKLRNDLKEALFNFNNSMVAANQTELPSGKPSSSAFSDAFETGSSVSKVRLTKRFSLNQSHADKGNAGPQFNLTLRNLRLLVERNLVATLVGLYILVSLTVIVVLILPYVFNFPRSFPTPAAFTGPMEDSVGQSRQTGQQVTHLGKQANWQPLSDYELLNQAKLKHQHQQQQQQVGMKQRLGQGNSRNGQGQAAAIGKVSPLGAQQQRVSKQQQHHLDSVLRMEADETRVPLATKSSSEASAPSLGKRGPARPVAAQAARKQQQAQQQQQQQQPTKARTVNSDFHGMWNVVHPHQCQPLKVPTCSRTLQSMVEGESGATSAAAKSALANSLSASIPYDKTLLPNQFTQTRQSQVERLMSKFDPVIDIKCYPLMPLFLCSIYAPKCVPLNQTLVSNWPQLKKAEPIQLKDSPLDAADLLETGPKQISGTKSASDQRPTVEHWSRLVPPCKSLCQEALRKCTFFFEVLSLKLLDPDDCEALPESSDTSVCIGQREKNLLIEATELQSCQENNFRCSDGECIPKKWRCDGYADCTDKSDEENCSKCARDTQFYCGQEMCINKEQVCNGIRDCRDGRDERQCLRLSSTNATAAGPEERRSLEVWSAVKNQWVPVCGAHWSPSPMSHEACQALGYSRANQTMIEYGRLESQPQLSARSTSKPLVSNGTTHAPPPNRPTIVDSLAQQRSSSTSAWFDVASGTTFIASSDSNLGQDTSIATENEQIVGIVEDVASQSALVNQKLGLTGRSDHWVTYERRPSAGPAETSDQLALIDEAEIKLRSVNSMLYHGPQAGCVDKPAHLVSTVYLQCQNFQCGRPVTSYSSRVRLLGQQQITPVSLGIPPRGTRRTAPSTRSLAAEPEIEVNENDEDDIEKEGERPKRHSQCLEIQEEFDLGVEDDSFDYDGEMSFDETFPDDAALNATTRIDQAQSTGESLKDLLFIDKVARENEANSQLAHEDQSSSISKRLVVGGIESMPGEFPYLAALHGGPDEVFFCGGVLISINWLLTAAHCVGNRTQPDGWMVKVGVTRRIASPAFVRKLKVRKIIKHPSFNQDSLFNNDIALILLEESVEFNQYLRPICLPRANLKLGPGNSKDCVVVGFGKSKFSQEANYLHVAHFVNVPIVHHSVCSNWYAEHGVNLTEGMLCAGYAEGKRDACQGDSGSGLFCRYSNTNQFFVAGVVSFGIKCATPKLPGVYTSVPLYVDWIEATTREHGYALG